MDDVQHRRAGTPGGSCTLVGDQPGRARRTLPVHFISEEELKRDHGGIPHGGFVLRSGKSAADNKFLLEFSLKLDSNPEFTSSVLLAYARAVVRMHAEGKSGAVTVFDIAPKYLSPLSEEEQRKQLL